MQSKLKASFFTLFFTFVNSMANIFFGLIYNQKVIVTYGSEVSGLIAAMTQFVSFFAVIEGGFTTAAIVASYKPVIDKDYYRLNNIFYTTRKFLDKIALLIAFCGLIIGGVYIKFINSPFDYWRTHSILVISVLSVVMSVSGIAKYTVILQGENKGYIQEIISLVCRTSNWIVSMILIFCGYSIFWVYAINVLNYALNVLLLKHYHVKKFNYIVSKGVYDKSLISGTGDILFQKIANIIFTSTDLILVSIFISLSMASVYSLYFQIFQSIVLLLFSIVQAPFNSFGQLYESERSGEEFEKLFLIYQNIIMVVSTIFLTVTGVLMIPFVSVYTKAIVDFNYIYPLLTLALYTYFFILVINRPFGSILNVTGNFKQQNIQCFAAAIINIILSVTLVNRYGVYGIVIGSIAGTFVILVANIVQVNRLIPKADYVSVYINNLFNYLLGIAFIYGSFRLNLHFSDMGHWICLAFVMTILLCIIVIGVNFVINFKVMKMTAAFVKNSVDEFYHKKGRCHDN